MDLKTNNRLCFSGDIFNVWKLYPNKTAAYELLYGFSNGFKIKYSGPRLALETQNLKSVFINQLLHYKK